MYNFPALYSDLSTLIDSLDECISCTCTEELNTTFELVVEYPSAGELSAQLTVGKFIYCKPNPYDNPQFFHIYRVSRTTKYMYTVYAEHISYAYNHFVCTPTDGYMINPVYASTLMNYLNLQSSLNPAPISGYSLSFSSTATSTARWSIPSHTEFKNVMSTAVKLYGGEWKFDNTYATFSDRRGTDRNVTLSNTTNLVSLRSDDDVSDLYTHIMPFWKGTDENGSIVTVYSNPMFIPIWSSSRSRVRPYIYDCSSMFTAKPNFGDLYVKAMTFANVNLSALGQVVSGFEAQIVQRGKTVEGAYLTNADHIEIGDDIHINVPEINLSTVERVTVTKYDVLRDMLTSVTIGKRRPEITDIFSNIVRKEESEEMEKEAEAENNPESEEPSTSDSDKLPDQVVKVSANEVYALYDNRTVKVTWTAQGSGNERHNFVKKVVTVEEEENNVESGNSGNDHDVGDT